MHPAQSADAAAFNHYYAQQNGLNGSLNRSSSSTASAAAPATGGGFHGGHVPPSTLQFATMTSNTSNSSLSSAGRAGTPSSNQIDSLENQPVPPQCSNFATKRISTMHQNRYPHVAQAPVYSQQQQPQQPVQYSNPPVIPAATASNGSPVISSHYNAWSLPRPESSPNLQSSTNSSRSQSLNLSQSIGGSAGRSGGYPLPSSLNLLQNFNIHNADEFFMPKKPQVPNECLRSACDPNVFRSTVNTFPTSAAILDKTRLPLALLIHPFKELSDLSVINSTVITRCKSCRSYINPYAIILERRRWRCNFCQKMNDLSDDFFRDPQTGYRMNDIMKRPELRHSSVEYIAPVDYMLRPPQPATYVFLFDVSVPALQTGYLEVFTQLLKESIKNLPGDKRKQICIMAHDTRLHYFSMDDSFEKPQLMTCPDTSEPFLPSNESYLFANINDCLPLIEAVLDSLPQMFYQKPETGSALGSSLRTAFDLLKPIGGRITAFQAQLPSVGLGALTPRSDGKHGKVEDKHLIEQDSFYKDLALECSAHQVAVDIVAMNSQYIDIPTLSRITQFTGGWMYHYPYLSQRNAIQMNRFESEMRRYLVRSIAFEAVMRIRCSRALSIKQFYGNFYQRSTDLVTLPVVNPDAGFGVTLSYEDDIHDQYAYCQAALLYTSSKGERRIRVHTLCVPTSTNTTDIFQSADHFAIAAILCRFGSSKALQQGLDDARQAFMNACIDCYSAFSGTLQSSARLNALNSPYYLRLLPMYILSLLKSDGFSPRPNIAMDERAAFLCNLYQLPHADVLTLIHPNFFSIHTGEMCLLMLSLQYLESTGVYLLDTGSILYLWLGLDCPFIEQMLGVPSSSMVPSGVLRESLPEIDSDENRLLHDSIEFIISTKSVRPCIVIARADCDEHQSFRRHFVADKTESSMSYLEFLQFIQKDVK